MQRKNNKDKNRLHRKFVRSQKQLIRRRSSKRKPRKWVFIELTLNEGVMEKLQEYAKIHHISVNTAITRCLKAKMIAEGWGGQHGVPKEHNKSLE